MSHAHEPVSAHTLPTPRGAASTDTAASESDLGWRTVGGAAVFAFALNSAIFGLIMDAGTVVIGLCAFVAGVAASVALRPMVPPPTALAQPVAPPRDVAIRLEPNPPGVGLEGEADDEDDDSMMPVAVPVSCAVVVIRAAPEIHAALLRAVDWAPVSLEHAHSVHDDEVVFLCHARELASSGPSLSAHLHARLGDMYAQVRVGIAVTPEDGPLDDARRLAGIAAKGALTGEPAWHDDVSRRLFGVGPFQSGDLTAALEAGQIVMAFQPFYTNERWTLAGAEVLIRWSHPECGELPPSRFLGAFRGKHDLVTLTQEVVTVACRKLSTWTASFGDEFRLVVNSGLAEFCDPSTFGSLAYLLDLAGPDRVRIDIHVDELLNMTDEEREMLVAHAEEGAQLIAASVTDVRQLDALAGLPVTGVKIDAFRLGALGVSQLEPLARAAADRGLQVFAVRVESPADLQRLREIEALSYVQGFALSHVVDAATIDRLGSPFAQVTIDPKASRPVVEARAAVELHL